MERITVRIDEETKRALEAEARQKGVSPSDVVRELLTSHLESRPERRTALDLARDIGLIGCARDLPADLSTNPQHFEGFGRG